MQKKEMSGKYFMQVDISLPLYVRRPTLTLALFFSSFVVALLQEY